MTKQWGNFYEYTPRDMNTLVQRKPHIRVATADNGRTTFHFYVAVRDWLQIGYESYVELLLDPDTSQIMFRQVVEMRGDKTSAVPVRGAKANAYITLAFFTKDFPIKPGKYPVELTEHNGLRAAILAAGKGPEK